MKNAKCKMKNVGPFVMALLFFVSPALSFAASSKVTASDVIIVDVAGLARFTLAKDADQPDVMTKAQGLQQTLGDNINLLKFIGYDKDQKLSAVPALAIRPNIQGYPTIFINGNSLVDINPETAALYGTGSQVLAERWLGDLKKVMAHVGQIGPEQILIIAPNQVISDMQSHPNAAEVNIGKDVVMRLGHAPAKLLTAFQRAATAFEGIRLETDYALTHRSSYDALARIKVLRHSDEYVLMAGAEPVCFVSKEDALKNKTDVKVLAERWAKNLRSALTKSVGAAT